MDDWGFEQLQPWLTIRQTMPVGLRDQRPYARASLAARTGSRDGAPTCRPRRGAPALCPAPTPPRPRHRVGPRRRSPQRHPTPTRPRQPRDHLDLPARHRPRRNHPNRPRTARTDDPRQRRPRAFRAGSDWPKSTSSTEGSISTISHPNATRTSYRGRSMRAYASMIERGPAGNSAHMDYGSRRRRERRRSQRESTKYLAWVFVASPILLLVFGHGRYSIAEAALMPAIGVVIVLWLRLRPGLPDHVASVEYLHRDDYDGPDALPPCFIAWCDCGWTSDDRPDEPAARSEALRHTEHVRSGL